MGQKTLPQKIFAFILVLLFYNLFAQVSTQDETDFQYALESVINEQLIKLGEDAIAKERFLVEQMRIINFEIKSRVTNINEIRSKYFDGLGSRLGELRELKDRLGSRGSASLNMFIERLESRIELTINEGRINYRRQKVFEDGLQLLYIAEEMINLDPGSSLEGDPKISTRLAASQEKLMNTFGEDQGVTYGDITSSADVTIFDLFNEWKRTNTIKYKLRWTDVQIIKNQLLKNSTAAQKDRMFKRELQSAVLAYNFGNLDLADRLFSEIVVTYKFINTLDDVYFLRGESNFYLGRYNEAEKIFNKLVEQYPTSIYTAAAYARLVRIANHFDKPENVTKYYQGFKRVATANDPLYNEVRFTTAVSMIASGAYEIAVDVINQISPASEFYIDSQYLLSQAYAGAQNYDDAEQVLLNVIKSYSLPPDYHFNIKMKLGYLNYEKGNYFQALKYLDQIGGSFPLYDRVLIGYGWTYYKMELEKSENEEKDFTFAKKYLELLIDHFYTSDYYLEAKSLLGYIYQIEQQPNDAIRQFDYVFRSRQTKEVSDKHLNRQDQIKELLTVTDESRNKALSENNLQAYVEANRTYSSLQDSLLQLSYSDISAKSIAAQNEIQRINAQIRELERLKGIAQERNSKSLVEKIESLQDHLRDTIDDFPSDEGDPRLGMNYYDEHPQARKESVLEDRNEKLYAMRSEAIAQRSALEKELFNLATEISNARAAKSYKRMIHLEVKRDRYESLMKDYDYWSTFAYNLDLIDSPIDVQKWSDYGAFGIANVNYAVKQDQLEKRSYYLSQIDKINQILNGRKAILNHKVNLIEGEINFMTRKVRRQERLRERAELDRKFEESYFDTHTSEFEESETIPPVIDDEEQE
jgi:TolA-binding protein